MVKRETWLPATLVAIVTAYAMLFRPAQTRLTDLSVYLGAVTGLRDGTSLYDFIRGDAPFTYPPFAGLLFLPLTIPPVIVVQAGWTQATLAAVVAIARMATRTDVPLVALLLVLSAPVVSDLRFGQVSLFLAAMILCDAVRRPGRTQGVLIGIAAAVKLTPLIFIPMLWCGGRRRAAVPAAATFLACGAAAAVVLPADSWRFWTTEIRDVDRIGAIASVGNQSLNGALLRTEIPSPVRSAAVLLLGGLIVLLALRRAARADNWFSATVVVGAASIVFSPVSWTHHQVWLALAVLLPIRPAYRWGAGTVMVLPATAVVADARLVLAVAVAAVLPLNQRPVSSALSAHSRAAAALSRARALGSAGAHLTK
jgi:alpha-1,2-mannosyltransferase